MTGQESSSREAVQRTPRGGRGGYLIFNWRSSSRATKPQDGRCLVLREDVSKDGWFPTEGHPMGGHPMGGDTTGGSPTGGWAKGSERGQEGRRMGGYDGGAGAEGNDGQKIPSI